MSDRVRYRVRQFLRGLRPHLSPAEVAEARARLSQREFSLFLHEAPRDRRHSMDLFLLLRRECGPDGQPASDDLLAAALLHDVGKGRLRDWHRVLYVLLNAASPGFARRLESSEGPGWQQALWRLRYHARIGAELLAAEGSSPRVVEVVRQHTA
ncbi:MAG: HD domain-containing protein, partial [Dehalococcoidia bacterium]